MRKLFYIALIFILIVPALVSADSFGPTLSILTPNNNAVVNKPSILILIQAWDADAAPSTPQVNKDGGGFVVDAGVVEDTNRLCGTNCKVFKYTWDLSSYTNDTTHTIQFRSSDGTNTSDSKIITITVKGTKTGDGYLLSRGRSDQVCIDCHTVVSHSSQSTDTGYGNWSILCTDCHTPHNTTNIMLIKTTITTPNSGDKPVALWNRSGDAVKSFVDSTATGANIKGVCQVCHTQTTGSGTSRWRNTGNGESPTHYGADGATQRCTTCHGHIEGFKGGGCDSCHGNPPVAASIGGPSGLATPATGATSPLSPGAHVKHTASPRSMLCYTCHTGNTMPTVSNTIQMGFVTNSTNYPGWGSTTATGGTFLAPQDSLLTNSYVFVSSDGGTTVTKVANNDNKCSSLYCHGGTLTSGSNSQPSWVGGSSQAACGTCHGATAASAPTPGSHTKHASSSGGNLGIACNKCHSNVVTGDTHVNGNVQWALDTADARFGASAIYGGSASGSTGGLAPSVSYGNCENLYCHSNGKVDGTVGVYTTPTWGGAAITCAGCHGTTTAAGTPDYTPGGGGADSVAANSHNKHTGAGTSTCVYCHSTTTTTGTTITGAVHINNTRDVAQGGTKTFSYAAPNCSAISCHGGNGAQWGATGITCQSCHAGAGDVDDTVYDNGTTGKIDSTEWTNYGHGQTGAVLPLTCDYCHDGGGVLHGVSTNPFRLANNNALGNGLNDACNVCHKTGASGYNPGGGLKTAATKVNKYHYGSNHDATRNGGQFCWDCHDPHGDGSNIKMVQAKPAKKSSTYGVPTQLPTNSVVFTNNTLATGATGFAMTSGTFEQGICNTCHTYSASAPTVVYYTSTSSTSHNSTTLCTNCHKHSSDTTYNGEAFKGGGCNGCHSYDTVAGSWGIGTHQDAPVNEGWGAHAKHIDHIKTRFSVALDANADTFGAGAAAKVCGTCHTNAAVDHSTGGGPRSINFGDGRYKEGSTNGTDGFSFLFGATNPAYNGVSGTSSSVNPKSCSNISCHFTTTPVWQSY